MPPARALITRSSLIAILAASPASVPLASERVEASYALHWGGFEVARFDVSLTADPTDYRIAYAARTTGLVGTLFPFTSAGASEGRMADPGPVPERYAGASERRAGRSAWTVIFEPDGGIAHLEITTPEDEEREPVPANLRKAPDPLSLALRATRAAAPGARVRDTTFDGKRAVIFELACAPAEDPLRPEATLAGLAIDRLLSCTLDGELAGGQSRRFGSGRDTERRPAEVLLSSEIVPGRYWPVRVEAETRFGAVVAELTALR